MGLFFFTVSRRVTNARALSLARWIQDDLKANSHWLVLFFSAIISKIDQDVANPFKDITISERIDFEYYIIIILTINTLVLVNLNMKVLQH